MNKAMLLISLVIVMVIIISIVDFKKSHRDFQLDVQKLLQKYVEDGTGIGAAIGYIDNGSIQYYTYGKKAVDGSSFIDKETIFEIGSITKVFTALALMEMVKQGKIRLDDPIEKYLPGVNVPQKDGHKITIWHLATHTSGLPRLPDNLNLQNISNPYADYSIEQLYEFLNSHVLEKKPGKKSEYSNLATGLLGHILSLVEQQNYDEFIKSKICIPLAMENTAQYLTPTMQEQLAYGHAMMKKVSNWDFKAFAGAGALRSNIYDMTQFLAANMGMVDTPLYESMKATQVEQCSIAHKQCFGWITAQKNDATIIWHNGGTGGYRSFIGFNPKNKKGVVILSNSTDDFPDELGFYILDPINFKVERFEYNKDLADSDYLSKFVGTFETEPTKFKGMDLPKKELQVMLFKNKLYYGNYQLLPDTQNVFRLKGLPATYSIQFVLDEKKNIIELQTIQPEGVFRAYPKK